MTVSQMDRITPPTDLLVRPFTPLSLGHVRPSGWLRDQLRIQADGLCGHLDEFWPDVARSRWIGGDAEGWERGPYWLDGTVPLAYLLDDERLQHKVRHWVDQILAHQQPDGWLGPVLDARYSYPYDAWPRFVLLKALIQYYDATGDERIPTAIERFLRKLQDVLHDRPLRSWAYYRWADLALSIYWLHERTKGAWLLDLAQTLQAQGFDWRTHVARFPYRDKSRPEECDLRSHGPNNAMGIKTSAVWYRQSGDPADRAAVMQMIAALERHHGQATGMFSCDEHLAGKHPSQGSELCAVVEYMYSLEIALTMVPDPALADRLESLAYNALSATISPDMWAHQYDQQVNQVQCRVDPDRLYTSNGPDANVFGLEPHFGCCTANMHQGWPKFVAHLWMRTQDGGLAAVAYAPCTVTTTIDGVAVEIATETTYPFGDTITMRVRTARPHRFPLYLRIPAWARQATLQIEAETVAVAAGSFHREERTWSGNERIVLQLPMAVRIERRFNASASLYRGPLLLALKIGEQWRQIKGELPHADWEITPSTPWNYALALDLQQPETSIQIETHPLGARPFSPDGAPVSAKVRGRRIAAWNVEHNAAVAPPPSPIASGEPVEELTLIPYGCTNLRIAEFPVLQTDQQNEVGARLGTS